eukprot:SAG31_NODE_1432_length_8373_cov_8.838289_7_plen_53_part_00
MLCSRGEGFFPTRVPLSSNPAIALPALVHNQAKLQYTTNAALVTIEYFIQRS